MKIRPRSVHARVLRIVEPFSVGSTQIVNYAPNVLAESRNHGFLGSIPDRGIAKKGELMIRKLCDCHYFGLGASREICSLFMLEP